MLDNNSTIESCGIHSGVTIHILRKKEKGKFVTRELFLSSIVTKNHTDRFFFILEPPKKITPICEADILHLVSAFKNAMKNPHYRGALQVFILFIKICSWC